MHRYIKRSIAILFVLPLVVAIALVIIRPTYLPSSLRQPNRNHRLETMSAMGIWAFIGSSVSGDNFRLYHSVLELVQKMYDGFERDANGVVYPGFYGGIEINGPRLTLLIVENRLEEAEAHDAFSHLLADDSIRQGFVEFSFAQLIETRALAAAAIDVRQGCFYADRAFELYIVAADNRVVIFIEQNYAEGRDLEAGFLQYVFDSPMIIAQPTFVFDLWWASIHPIVDAASVLIVAYVIFGVPIVIVILFRSAGNKRKEELRAMTTQFFTE